MQHQPTRREPRLQRGTQGFGLAPRPTVTDRVIRIALKGYLRMLTRHPRVERVVQEQVGQDRTDHASLRGPRTAWLECAILPLHRRLQPALNVEQYPRAVGMPTQRAQQQLPVETVEKRLDVDVEYPVVPPATLAGEAYRIERRPTRSVSVGVGMEHRLQPRLQVPSDNLLGDSVRHRRDPQRSRTTTRFRYVHPPHRRWEVAPRGQPVPEFVEVGRKVNLELRNRLSVYASRSLIGFHFLESLPDLPLRDIERLCRIHAAHPVTGWPPHATGHRSPFGPAPFRSLQPYYGLLRPCASHWYSGSRGALPLERLPLHRGDRFPRSAREPDPDSRRLQAGCHMGRLLGSAHTDPGATTPPRFRHRRYDFGMSSAVRLRSSLRISPDGVSPRLLLQRSPRPLLKAAACSGLESAPTRRLRRAYLHLSHSSTPPSQLACSWHTVIGVFGD